MKNSHTRTSSVVFAIPHYHIWIIQYELKNAPTSLTEHKGSYPTFYIIQYKIIPPCHNMAFTDTDLTFCFSRLLCDWWMNFWIENHEIVPRALPLVMRGCPLTIDVSRLEQFHLWSENCLWHSCTASSIPKINKINKDQKGLLEASIFQIFAYPLVSGILD